MPNIVVHMTVVLDRAALDRVREQLRTALDTPGADPLMVRDVVEQLLKHGPVVRYVMT